MPYSVNIDYNPLGQREAMEELDRRVRLLPDALRAKVYGDGFLRAARRAAQRARGRCPRGAGPALTNAGEPRKRLAESISVKPVGWKWGGVKVRRSAAIIVAEQPHAHLVELGTVRTRAKPFLAPSVHDTAVLADFRAGTNRSFRRTLKRMETGKLTRAEGRGLSV